MQGFVLSKAGWKCWLLFAWAFALVSALPATAQAGIPECGGIRLEDVANCEIRGELDCEAGCDDIGVYKKACATKLHTVCREECTLDAEPTCTDECTVSCESDCDRGVNITCIHNCFGECVGSCDATCDGADDPEQCRASCEATCDGECDIQCAPVVDASCYKHCIECCHGSCGAQANMDCQTNCQDEQFESCEYEFRADCSASCSGNGALFCDGEYVLAGDELWTCVNALLTRGIGALEGEVDVSGEIDLSDGQITAGGDSESSAKVKGCAFAPSSRPVGSLAGFAALALGLLFAARRRW